MNILILGGTGVMGIYLTEILATENNNIFITSRKKQKSNKKNWSIARPYITFGDNRLQLGVYEKETWLFRSLKRKTIIFSSDIACKKTTITYGGDVAFLLSKIVGNSKCLGESYNLTSNDARKWSDILELYKNSLEKYLNKNISIALFDNAEDTMVIKNKYQLIYDRLYDRSFDNTKIMELVGDNFTFSNLEKIITSCIENIKYDDSNINWEREAIIDRLLNEKTSILFIKGFKNISVYIINRYFPTMLTVIKKIYHSYKQN